MDPHQYAKSHNLPRREIAEMWNSVSVKGGFVSCCMGSIAAADARVVAGCMLHRMENDPGLTPHMGKVHQISAFDATPTSKGQLTEGSMRYGQGIAGHSVRACFIASAGKRKDKAVVVDKMVQTSRHDVAVKDLHGKMVRLRCGEEAKILSSLTGDMGFLVQGMGGVMGGVPYPVSKSECCLWCPVEKSQLLFFLVPGIWYLPWIPSYGMKLFQCLNVYV